MTDSLAKLDAVAATGTLLGKTYWSPQPNFASYTTTSSAMADVDVGNLTVTFTAPASGSVRIKLSALAEAYGSVAGTNPIYFWAVASAGFAANADQGPFIALSMTAMTTANVTLSRIAGEVLVTGLTAGTSYTFRWRHAAIGSSGTATGAMFAGGSAVATGGGTLAAGAAVMEAIAA